MKKFRLKEDKNVAVTPEFLLEVLKSEFEHAILTEEDSIKVALLLGIIEEVDEPEVFVVDDASDFIIKAMCKTASTGDRALVAEELTTLISVSPVAFEQLFASVYSDKCMADFKFTEESYTFYYLEVDKSIVPVNLNKEEYGACGAALFKSKEEVEYLLKLLKSIE